MSVSERFTRQELEHMPCHIAAIMDGNGRWAQSRGMPRSAGHKAGSETFRRVAELMADMGVKYFTVYAFSTENWKRPSVEINAILSLFEQYLNEAVDSMAEKGIKLGFWGDTSLLPEKLKKLIQRTDEISKSLDGRERLCVNICFNYGGRQEIARSAAMAAADLACGKISEITPDVLSNYMYSAGTPDPDLIIRTGNEFRVSNFLLWQSAYSEYYISEKLWPDMDEDEIVRAVKSFLSRNRRFGGL